MTDTDIASALDELSREVRTPDASLIRAEAARRGRSRRRGTLVASAGLATLLAVGGFALTQRDAPRQVVTVPPDPTTGAASTSNDETDEDSTVDSTDIDSTGDESSGDESSGDEAAPAVVTVTISEGATIDEIVEALAVVRTDLDPDAFVAELDDSSIASRFLPSTPANLAELPGFRSHYEGLLAPGTYEFDREASEAELLQLLAAAMEDRFDQALAAEGGSMPTAGPDQRPLTEYEVVIVASIIELEGMVETDGPSIARVIYNRLDNGVPLGIISNVCYARQVPCSALTSADVSADSPWNTHINQGLPPTPIAAPSLSAIRAALSPADGAWFYYVMTNHDGVDGALTFASTEEEFLAARQLCADRGLCEN